MARAPQPLAGMEENKGKEVEMKLRCLGRKWFGTCEREEGDGGGAE